MINVYNLLCYFREELNPAQRVSIQYKNIIIVARGRLLLNRYRAYSNN